MPAPPLHGGARSNATRAGTGLSSAAIQILHRDVEYLAGEARIALGDRLRGPIVAIDIDKLAVAPRDRR
jgi:hypothetical protein